MQSEDNELEIEVVNPILRHLESCGYPGSNFEGIFRSINGTPHELPLTYTIDHLIKTRAIYYSQGRYYRNPPEASTPPEKRSLLV